MHCIALRQAKLPNARNDQYLQALPLKQAYKVPEKRRPAHPDPYS